jgi:hypothetical protein
MIRKAFEKVALLLVWCAAILIGFYFCLLLIVHLPPVQRYLLSLTKNQVNSTIRGNLSINSYFTNLLTSIDLYSVKFKTSSPYHDSVSINRLQINFGLLSLLKHKVSLPNIRANGGNIYALRDKSGNIKIPGLPLKKTPEEKKQKWQLEIGTVCINNVNLIFYDLQLGSITVDNISGCIRYDSLEAQFTSGHIKIVSPRLNTEFERSYLDIKLQDFILYITGFTLEGNQLNLAINGQAPLTSNRFFDLHGKITASLAPLTTYLIPANHRISGIVNSQFELTGNLSSPCIKADLNSSSLLYRDIVIDSLNLHAHLNQKGTLIIHSNLYNRFASVRMNVSAILKNILHSPQLKEYNLEAHVEKINMGLIADYFNLKNPRITGVATASLKGSGTNLKELPKDAFLMVTASERGPLDIDTLWTVLNIKNNTWSLQSLIGNGNHFSGQGKVRLLDVMEGNIKGTIRKPAPLSSYFLKYPMKGTLLIDASFSNLFKDPMLTLSVLSDSLLWRGFTLSDLKTSLTYAGKWIIDSLFTVITADMQKVIIPEIKNLQGNLHANLQARGTIFDPVISSNIQIIEPAYQKWMADSFSASLFYGDKRLRIDTLSVTKDTLALKTAGIIDISKPGYSLQLLSKVSSGKAAAVQLHLTGKYIDDTVQLISVIDYARIGLLYPQIPLSPCIEGGLQLNALLDRQYCLRSGKLLLELREEARVLPNPFLFLGVLTLDSGGFNGNLRVIGKKDSVSVLLTSLQAPFQKLCLQQAWPMQDGTVIRFIASDFEYGELVETFFPQLFVRGQIQGVTEAVMRNGLWYIDGKLTTTADTINWSSQTATASGLKADAVLKGTLRNPIIDFSVLSKSITLNENLAIDTRAYGNVYGKALQIDSLTSKFNNEGFLNLEGLIPLSWKEENYPNIKFQLYKVPLMFTNSLIHAVLIEQGVASGKGRLSRYNSEGNLKIDNLRFFLNNCNGVAGPFNAFINLKNNRIILDTIDGKWGDGHLSGKAEVLLSTNAIEDINSRFKIQDLSISCMDAVRVGIEDATSRIYKSGNNYLLDARIKLNDSRVEKIFTISELFNAFTEGRRGLSLPSAIIQNTRLKTEIDLNSNLLIDTNLGRFLLDGKMSISGSAARPYFNGVLNIEEGRIRYLDRDFEIQEGTLRQFSATEINPTLDIAASSEVQDLTTEVQPDYTVNVQVSGTMKNPKITLSSNPSLEQQQIINLLTFGGIQGGPGFQTRGGQILSSYLTGLGSQYIEQITGLGNVNISGNIFAQDGGLSLTVNQKLTSRISVSYQTDITDIGQYTVQVMYRVFPQLRLIGRTDSRGNSDAGVKFIYRR